MTIEIDNKELHEIVCGLSKNCALIRGRMRHAQRDLAMLEDRERRLYLSTLVALRSYRIERIESLIKRLLDDGYRDTDSAGIG